MMCSQRPYAVLAVYHRKEPRDNIYLSCIKYDKQFCKEMTKELINFYNCFNDTEYE